MRVLGAFAALIAVAAGLFAAARRLLNRPEARRRRRHRRSRGPHHRRRRGRRALRPGGGRDAAARVVDGHLGSAPPRAPGAHLLALPHARDARDRAREVHGDRPLHRRADQAVHAAQLPRARVRDGRRGRHRPLADPQGAARRAGGTRGRRVPRDRGAPLRARRRGPSRCTSASRSPTSTRLVSGIALWFYRDAVTHPRHRHPRLPAVARAPGTWPSRASALPRVDGPDPSEAARPEASGPSAPRRAADARSLSRSARR